MNEFCVRFKRPKAIFREYTNSTGYRESMNKIIAAINEARTRLEYHRNSPLPFSITTEHYRTHVSATSGELVVLIRDNKWVNAKGRAFCIVGIKLDLKTLLFRLAELQLPYVNGWNGRTYMDDLSKWGHGTELLSSVRQFGAAIQYCRASVIMQDQEDESENWNETRIQGFAVPLDFEDADVQEAYHSLCRTIDSYSKSDVFDKRDIQLHHEIERMTTQELDELRVLFRQIEHEKKKAYSACLVELLQAMEQKIKVATDKESRKAEEKLKRQLYLLQKRYSKAAD